MAEPEDYQEVHSPTEPVEVVISHFPRRVTEQCRIRRSEARLWAGMSEGQVRAADRIRRASEAVSGFMAAKIQMWERLDATDGEINERILDLIADQGRWFTRIQTECPGLDAFAAWDIIVQGKWIRDVEHARGKRHGWARQNLHDCLLEYVWMKGWR